jgi:hypothetical protein
MEAKTRVAEDGSGTLTTAVGIAPSDETALSELGVDPNSDYCQQLESRADIPAGGTISKEERDGATWCVVSLPFEDLKQLTDLYGQIGDVQINKLALDSGFFVYDVNVDLRDLTAEGVDPAILETLDLSLDWSVTPPGTVQQDNADQAQDGTFVWHLQPGEATHVRVISQVAPLEPPQGSAAGPSGILANWRTLLAIGLAVVCLGALVVAIGGLALFLVIRSRRSSSADETD